MVRFDRNRFALRSHAMIVKENRNVFISIPACADAAPRWPPVAGPVRDPNIIYEDVTSNKITTESTDIIRRHSVINNDRDLNRFPRNFFTTRTPSRGFVKSVLVILDVCCVTVFHVVMSMTRESVVFSVLVQRRWFAAWCEAPPSPARHAALAESQPRALAIARRCHLVTPRDR
ncbi:hypothetical protein EVAR_7704_1 [Eumeta japonica]|uniref:Uncharacterized protein n=1 Tax=Eumeta variegata TaxID=151549 RepID=A0A4C1TJI3_EUMVA|nr:hypothetical protein EVAR_7704_1 [Eumeta japonica]